jgi:hypothetical protein
MIIDLRLPAPSGPTGGLTHAPALPGGDNPVAASAGRTAPWRLSRTPVNTHRRGRTVVGQWPPIRAFAQVRAGLLPREHDPSQVPESAPRHRECDPGADHRQQGPRLLPLHDRGGRQGRIPGRHVCVRGRADDPLYRPCPWSPLHLLDPTPGPGCVGRVRSGNVARAVPFPATWRPGDPGGWPQPASAPARQGPGRCAVGESTAGAPRHGQRGCGGSRAGGWPDTADNAVCPSSRLRSPRLDVLTPGLGRLASSAHGGVLPHGGPPCLPRAAPSPYATRGPHATPLGWRGPRLVLMGQRDLMGGGVW